jgi:nitroimidazol reductase NimA-like FMN-containing flavoprotein (pyridoxamine 5'-phosphate oxidase superfamily)
MELKRDKTEKALTEIRRKDRTRDEAWIKAFLHRAPFGSVATARDGQPFIVMRNFAYDEAAHAIYLHGALEGRFIENVRANDRVCFSAGEMGELTTAKKAINFGVEYAGVVVFGRVVIVGDPAEARHGLELLMEKYFPDLRPGDDYEPIADADIEVTAVFRLEIESWSGKAKSL